MANSWIHAESSAKHFKAGKPEDYHPIHLYIDRFKSTMGDVRHRAFLHNTEGPFMVESVFGPYIELPSWEKLDKDGTPKLVKILIRDICENHIVEDLGCIPSPSDWLNCMSCKTWMGGKRNKFIGREELLQTVIIASKGGDDPSTPRL